MKFWDTNNMHQMFLATIRPINKWKMKKYPYLDFEVRVSNFDFKRFQWHELRADKKLLKIAIFKINGTRGP
jgi:hypothetical protein